MKQLSIIFENYNENSGGGSKIPVGVYTDGSVVFDGVTKGEGFYDVNYRMPSTGQVVNKRHYKVTQATPADGETMEDAISKREDNQIAHFVHLAVAFFGLDKIKDMKGDTAEQLIDALMKLLNGKKGEKVNLKVVPDYKEKKYPSIPSYPQHVEKYEEGVVSRLNFSKRELEDITPASGPTTNTSNYV